jgi:hypothetical protein
VATNIEAPFKSEHAAGVLGPIMQTTIPPVATADQLAATITWLLSEDASTSTGRFCPPTAAGRPSEDQAPRTDALDQDLVSTILRALVLAASANTP